MDQAQRRSRYRLEPMLGERIAEERAVLYTLGLNHLTWHNGFTVDGEDLWPRIFQNYVETARNDPEPEWDVHTLETLSMVPNYYLQYFYYTGRKFEAQKKWPPSRAEEVMEIEKGLLKQYADPALTEPPADLMKRGGAYYSTLATQLLDSHYNNSGQVHIVNVPNHGAVPDWPGDWVIELPCKVDRLGFHPLPVKPLPPVCSALVGQVKAYELYTVEAGVHGDRAAAYRALLTHPLGPQADQVQAVFEDMLETNHKYVPQFFTE
jgi:6-phospho-beta-glucosidase